MGTSQLLDHQGTGSAFYVICLLITRPDHNAPDVSHAITNTTTCWVQFAGFINQKTKLNLTGPDVLPLNRAPYCINSALYVSHKPLSNVQQRQKNPSF